MRTKKNLLLPAIFALILAALLNLSFKLVVLAQELVPPCPTNRLAVAHHVGGWEDETRWLTPTWEGGDWVFSSTIATSLTVPDEGMENWLDYWHEGSALRITEGTISTTNASYHCVDAEIPEEAPEEPAQPAGPNTEQREACSQDCLPCPATIDEINNLVGGENGNWTAPEGDWGAWSFTATNPVTLTVPQLGQLDWLDYWASQPVSTSLGSIYVSEASYTCKPLIVETPQEPETPEEPVEQELPNTQQREACSENCPPCPITSQDVSKLVSNGEGEWQAPEGPWGSWKFTSTTPVTLTVPLSGTIDWVDYWHTSAISASIGLVTNVTTASYTCRTADPEKKDLFLPLLSFADEEIFEVPSGPVVQSPWSCLSSNEDAAAKLGGDYWNWAPPKESEPWASWVFHSEIPKEVCHPGGDFGGFLEHFSLGRLESGCFSQPIQDASFTCEDVED